MTAQNPGDTPVNHNAAGQKSGSPLWTRLVAGIAVGIGIGVALGMAMENMGAGLAIGTAMGAGIGTVFSRQQPKNGGGT